MSILLLKRKIRTIIGETNSYPCNFGVNTIKSKPALSLMFVKKPYWGLRDEIHLK